MVVLEPGEAVDSDRVKAECGAFAMAVVHYAYEQWSQYGVEPPAFLAGIWDDYTALLAKVPAERRHLRIHLGHNCWVEPEEERFLTPEVLTERLHGRHRRRPGRARSTRWRRPACTS